MTCLLMRPSQSLGPTVCAKQGHLKQMDLQRFADKHAAAEAMADTTSREEVWDFADKAVLA